jgi:hypothetical protein
MATQIFTDLIRFNPPVIANPRQFAVGEAIQPGKAGERFALPSGLLRFARNDDCLSGARPSLRTRGNLPWVKQSSRGRHSPWIASLRSQ